MPLLHIDMTHVHKILILAKLNRNNSVSAHEGLKTIVAWCDTNYKQMLENVFFKVLQNQCHICHKLFSNSNLTGVVGDIWRQRFEATTVFL